MANNGMVSEMPILFMPRLRELNIDNNNITDLSCLREKQLLPKLEFLSAANNPLL
jgi:Leucine-rich repeat (LRR) protein